ncbi:nucleophosmin 1 [Microdochium nivale]|nr:nucleophosmin 1 [Microdochium nivale]
MRQSVLQRARALPQLKIKLPTSPNVNNGVQKQNHTSSSDSLGYHGTINSSEDPLVLIQPRKQLPRGGEVAPPLDDDGDDDDDDDDDDDGEDQES